MESVLPSHPRRRQLCSSCSKLGLKSMLSKETAEIPMGPLSDYTDPDCPFCNLIHKTARFEEHDSTTGHPTRPFLQSRSPLSTKINGLIQHPQPRLLLAATQSPLSQQQTRPVNRQIDRVKNRFITAEIEQLPDVSAPMTTNETSLLVRRNAGSRIEDQMVKSWLQECKGHRHSTDMENSESNKLFQREGGFRLIDVVDKCLVQQTARCEYVALSYVWGRLSTILNKKDAKGHPILLATKDNVKRLSNPKSLSPTQLAKAETARIPLTVLDAMEFTERIGKRYLWVDTLCIVQDDHVEMPQLMGSMDYVYNSAVVTIIAVDGSDADAGLRGVRPRRGRPIELTNVVDPSDDTNLSLSICPPSLCEEVRRGTWHTRAWTFQEQCLSRRCLYFTAEEVYFNCVEKQWREAYIVKDRGRKVEFRTGPPWWPRNLREDRDPTPYHYLGGSGELGPHDYQVAVQAYSRMNLSFPEDILNAFTGVFNRFNRSNGAAELSISQTQGIPAHLLYQGILWFPSDGCRRGSYQKTEHQKLATQFSTWSWASWAGPVEFVFEENSWLSRIISHAPSKGKGKDKSLHVPIACWHFGGSRDRFWSHEIWKAACTLESKKSKRVSDKLSHTETYLSNQIGIDPEFLRSQSALEAPAGIACGELGFYGAYLPAEEVKLFAQKGRIATMETSGYHGEFRFDDSQPEEVNEFIVVVAADTVEDKRKKIKEERQSIFLGVATQGDVSRRIGIGFVYYSSSMGSLKPKWRYKHFRLI